MALTMMGMVLMMIAMVLYRTVAIVHSVTMAMVHSIVTKAMVYLIVTKAIHQIVTKAMAQLILTTAMFQSEAMFPDLPMVVVLVDRCVICMPGQTVSVWVTMTRCSPEMAGGTVM